MPDSINHVVYVSELYLKMLFTRLHLVSVFKEYHFVAVVAQACIHCFTHVFQLGLIDNLQRIQNVTLNTFGIISCRIVNLLVPAHFRPAIPSKQSRVQIFDISPQAHPAEAASLIETDFER